jgi:hypothetical protein
MKKAIIYIKVLSQHFIGGIEEDHRNLSQVEPVGIESEMYQI